MLAEEVEFTEQLTAWTESVGINLDRDPEHLYHLNTHFVKKYARNNQTRPQNSNALLE